MNDMSTPCGVGKPFFFCKAAPSSKSAAGCGSVGIAVCASTALSSTRRDARGGWHGIKERSAFPPLQGITGLRDAQGCASGDQQGAKPPRLLAARWAIPGARHAPRGSLWSRPCSLAGSLHACVQVRACQHVRFMRGTQAVSMCVAVRCGREEWRGCE